MKKLALLVIILSLLFFLGNHLLVETKEAQAQQLPRCMRVLAYDDEDKLYLTSTGVVSRSVVIRGSIVKNDTDVILQRYLYDGVSNWEPINPWSSTDTSDETYNFETYYTAKDYTVGVAWVYKDASGGIKTITCSTCLRTFDAREVNKNFGIKRLIYPGQTSGSQVIAGLKRYVGLVGYGPWSGDNKGVAPPFGDGWRWSEASGVNSVGGEGVISTWSAGSIIASNYNYPKLLPTQFAFTLTAPDTVGNGAYSDYNFNNLIIYSRDLRQNPGGTCGSLPALSQMGLIEVSLFEDLDLDGIKDAGEALVPTSVLGSTNVYLMAKSGAGSYTAFSFVGENYVEKAVASGSSYRMVMKQSEIPAGYVVTKWSVNYTGTGQPAAINTTYKDCQQWGLATHCTVSEGADADWPLSINPNYTAHVYLGLKEIPTYTLSGRVWMDTVTPTCAVNTNEPKLQGRTVTVTGLGKSGVTDANGSYSITGIPAGTYEVCVDSPPGNPYLACRRVRDAGGTWADAPATSALCSQVTITTLDKNLNLGFRPTYTISGRVWKDTVMKNCWINQPEGEVRLQGRTVSIEALGLSDVTDNNGWYALSGIPSGVEYDLCVDIPPNTSNPWDLACAREKDGAAAYVLLPDPPALCAKVTVRDVDKTVILGLRPHWNLTGYVWNDTPDPNCAWDAAPPPEEGKFNNLQISVTGTDPLKTGATGPNGENYSITDIEEGSYQVCTTKPTTYDWKLMCAKDEGGSPLTITGDCAALSLTADKTLNFGLRQFFPPWFQVSDSDVHSNGDLTVDISSQATNPCFVAVGRGFGGLVTAVGGIYLNGQPVSCIVNKRWQIPQYDPIDWAKTVRLNWGILTQAKDPPGWGTLEANTVYYKKLGLDVTPPGYTVKDNGVPGGVAVLVVEGNLNFNGGDFKASDPDKMGLIFLVRNGQTTVAKNVGSIDALVLNEKGDVEDGGTITVVGKGDQKDDVLTVNGGLFAEEGLSFQRDRALETDENKEPVIILNFNPLYLALLGPDIPGLTHRNISWREVQMSQ